jgi:predicted PurR-regulated permease PerM
MEPYLKFKSIAVFVAMILIIIPIIILLVIVINGLIQNVPSIISFAKSLNLTSLNNLNAENYTFVKHYIPSSFYPDLNSVINAINSEVTDILRGVLDYVVKILESIPLALIQLFIFFASTFYFVRDGDKLWEYVDYLIPLKRKHYFNSLFKEIDKVLKSIFVGHFLTAIITGILAGIGFIYTRIPVCVIFRNINRFLPAYTFYRSLADSIGDFHL